MENPFQPTKFEWEKRPIIWLSSRAKNLIGSIKPTYISGSRGSGKTTILRSLYTRQISNDSFLRKQHGARRLTWFGQYLQFNETLQEKTDILTDLLMHAGESEDVVAKLFHTYFELTLLYHFLNDLNIFLDSEFLHFKAKSEKEACDELQAILSKSRWVRGKQIGNFQDARRLLREIQQEFLKTKSSLDVEGLREIINVFQPGTMLRLIKENALPTIQSSQFNNSQGLDFFLLLDDCENLSERQQIALNSYIRRTEGVAKWVVSFLTDRFNTTQTNLKDTTLNDEDRTILPLNDLSDSDFTEFCEKVTNLRLTKFLEHSGAKKFQPELDFRFDATFGTFSYNALIGNVIKSSQNQQLLEFNREVEGTKGVLTALIRKANHRRFSCEKNQTPYIEHLVIKALQLNISQYALPKEQLSLAKTIDGKQAAAYIGFCAKYNLRPMFAGANFVKAISHNCIRDYLDTMASLFDVFRRSSQNTDSPTAAYAIAQRFAPREGKSIGAQTQNQAIHEVSDSKIKSLQQLKGSEPHIVRIVLAIANLQKQFEHDIENWDAVKSSVRGKYVVEFPKQQVRATKIADLVDVKTTLERLEYDRYIRILRRSNTANSTQIAFVLHRRLRPFFRCGLSGPYDPVISISPIWLFDALNYEEGFDPEKFARHIYSQIVNTEQRNNRNQGTLPL